MSLLVPIQANTIKPTQEGYTMKIKPEHYNHLKNMVTSSRVFPELMDYRERGLSDMRYRWDCLWSINYADRATWFDEVYEYANDEHIDTALRKITNTN